MTDTVVVQLDEDPSSRGDLTRQIREAILGAEFAPHQRLIEADLSERYDASRAAVRTALLNLANEGLVERVPNRGARVRAISVDEAVEIVEVRIGLETLCARKAAEHLTDADADGLRTLRDDIGAAVASGNLVEYSRLNQELDRRIRVLSRHATATQLLERLRAQSARHQFRLAFHPGRAAQSAPEHIAIIDAILSRDPDAAEAATRAHLTGIVDVLRGMD
ncbi:GntR family transcriptional regulator [Microbacterium sp. BK668]|uniref:GntR family transcriptional regulator n=1 Tax=Microbacterium sp. BK668 TaxID=2512118 RepID=UPI00105E88F0|nr:GntR family transcriptional regulator [Microbacterium sp. BK668]TDN87791.1 DNA-binding GntR family transcriptional regulator [Microbacterium sp. BK668]